MNKTDKLINDFLARPKKLQLSSLYGKYGNKSRNTAKHSKNMLCKINNLKEQ